jgi:hypothetical protein
MNITNQCVQETRSIGSIALEALSDYRDAYVFGKTSKGVFIKTSGRWLVFLSFEQFRGPLTITFDRFNPSLDLIAVGSPVRFSPLSIFLPDLGFSVSTAGSQVWLPANPSINPLGAPRRYENLVSIAEVIASKKMEVGLGRSIAPLLGRANTQPPHPIIDGVTWADIKRLQMCIGDDYPPLSQQLSTWLGTGPGLTPSADDFIIGLLLTLNRWHIPLIPSDRLHQLNLRIVKDAYEKTTTLSANLIDCAVQGLADERLICALDWIVTGVDREPEIIAHLLEWGNSSGVDAFAGMVVALSASY